MRRYAVRFLIAVLTFGIGVALSLALGLFRVQNSKFELRQWGRSKSCSNGIRVARPSLLTVDSQPADPLRLVYLGTISDLSRGEELRMRFSVENRSNKTVSGYWISANEIWARNGRSGARDLDWTLFEFLEPGESGTITLPRSVEGTSLRVAKVQFQDGSTWINPRASQ